MDTEKRKRAVGFFAKREDARLALQELKDANFPMKMVSIIAKDGEHEDDIVGVEVQEHIDNKAEEGAVTGAVAGATTGGLTGLLVGLGLLAIPGVGPIMLAGAEATAIASALAGGAIGTASGGLTGALIGLGIPDNEAKIYSDLVDKGYYLLIVNGDEREIAIAEMILRNRNIENWSTYHISAVTSTPIQGRYQYAAGLFFIRRDLEQALEELKTAEFPMEQVTIVAKSIAPVTEISGIPITAFDYYNFAAIDISNDVRKEYKYRVNLGDYLIVLSGTAIQLAAAQNILERHNMNNYNTFRPYIVTSDMVENNKRVLSSTI